MSETPTLTVTPTELATITTALALAHDYADTRRRSLIPIPGQLQAEAVQPAAIDLVPILRILIPLLPILKPIVKQLVLDNLDPALDALFKAIADAAAKA